jgi:hypothetical protein
MRRHSIRSQNAYTDKEWKEYVRQYPFLNRCYGKICWHLEPLHH